MQPHSRYYIATDGVLSENLVDMLSFHQSVSYQWETLQ